MQVVSQSSQDVPNNASRFKQVQTVLIRVLFLNLLVAIAKVVVGLLTGALAMVADGIHSSVDASSNVIGIVGTAIAARPADENHPYGHRRYETMATLTIGAMLLLAGWEIVRTALAREATPEVTPLNFAVMIGTMVVNVTVVLYETSHGKRLSSDLLLADAAQTRTDLVVSFSVIVGLGLSALGIAWADTVIAMLIAVLIGWTAFGILWKTTQILVDAAPVNPAEIQKVIKEVPGIDNVLRIRSRGPLDMIHADIDVQVPSATTADHASAIATEISSRVKSNFEGIDEVQVHFAPHHDQPQDFTLLARSAADALGLSIHEVTQIITSEGIVLEMHVEVQPTLTLAQAHQQVTDLERRVKELIPELNGVLTHIEPANQPGAVMQTQRAAMQRDQALEIARKLFPDAHWHDATVRLAMGGYAMTLHCWLPGSLSVQEAHEIAEEVETQIRAAMPQFQRVTIHTEPPES